MMGFYFALCFPFGFAFFQGLELSQAQQETAIRWCQEQMVNDVSDLWHFLASDPSMLEDLLPSEEIRGLVLAWYESAKGSIKTHW